MRYRLAKRRPGRNRPSLKYSAELEVRDELAEAGRGGGSGEVAVAKSRVAVASGLLAAPLVDRAPQAEQKRPVAGISVPQVKQTGMIFP